MGKIKDYLLEAEENAEQDYVKDELGAMRKMIKEDYDWCKKSIAEIGEQVEFAIIKRLGEQQNDSGMDLGVMTNLVVHAMDHLDAMMLHVKTLEELNNQNFEAEKENVALAEDIIHMYERKVNKLREQGIEVEFDEEDIP